MLAALRQHREYCMGPRGLSQGVVRRQQLGAKAFGERDVRCVVRREVRAQLQHSGDQLTVSMSHEWQIQIVHDRVARAILAKASREKCAPDHRSDFDVAQRRYVQRRVVGFDRGTEGGSAFRAEEVFDERRRVSDDVSHDLIKRLVASHVPREAVQRQ